MPRADYKTCRLCKGHTSAVGPLSHTRLCLDCSKRVAIANYLDLTTHSGPWFRHWRGRIAASVGATLLDDQSGER